MAIGNGLKIGADPRLGRRAMSGQGSMLAPGPPAPGIMPQMDSAARVAAGNKAFMDSYAEDMAFGARRPPGAPAPMQFNPGASSIYRQEQPLLPATLSVWDRNVASSDLNYQQGMRQPYGPGGASGVMERARMPSQPVDGRYAVAPRGDFAQGGRYVMPGQSQAAPAPMAPIGGDGYTVPPVSGASGQGFMMIGGQPRMITQLPGRSLPTLVPQGSTVEQAQDGSWQIQTGGVVDPRYDRPLPGSAINGQVRGGIVNPVIRDSSGMTPAEITARNPTLWAERKAAYQAQQAAKEFRRQASSDAIMAQRIGRPVNPGGGFGMVSAPAITGGLPNSLPMPSGGGAVVPALPPIDQAVAGAAGLDMNNQFARLQRMGYPLDQIRQYFARQQSQVSDPNYVPGAMPSFGSY